METKTIPGKRRRPLWKRRPFWVVSGLAALATAGAVYYFVTQDFSIKPAEDVQTGEIHVKTAPEKATVLIDDKEQKDKSPAEYKARVGKHKVTLRLAGYDEAIVNIEVLEGQPASIQHTFTKDGKLSVDEEPAQFKTYTNDKYRYRLRHPSRWRVDTASQEAVSFYDTARADQQEEEGAEEGSQGHAHGEERASLAVVVQPNPGNLAPKDWYQSREEYAQEDQSQIKTRELTVTGRPAFQYETPYGFVPYLITVVTGNGNTYLLQQIQGSPERQTYDQVIQTFTLF